MLSVIWTLCLVHCIFRISTCSTNFKTALNSPSERGIESGGPKESSPIKSYSVHGDYTEISSCSSSVVRYRENTSGSYISVSKYSIGLEPSGISIIISGKCTISSSRQPGEAYDLIAFNDRDKICIGKDCFGMKLVKFCVLFPTKSSDLPVMQSAAFLIMTEATVKLPIPTGGLICCIELLQIDAAPFPIEAAKQPAKRQKLCQEESAPKINVHLVPSSEPLRTGQIFCDDPIPLRFKSFFVKGQLFSPSSLSAKEPFIEDGSHTVTLRPSSIEVSEPRIKIVLDSMSGNVSVEKASDIAMDHVLFSVNRSGHKVIKLSCNGTVRASYKICLGFSNNPELLEVLPNLVTKYISEGISIPELPEGSMILCVEIAKLVPSTQKTVLQEPRLVERPSNLEYASGPKFPHILPKPPSPGNREPITSFDRDQQSTVRSPLGPQSIAPISPQEKVGSKRVEVQGPVYQSSAVAPSPDNFANFATRHADGRFGSMASPTPTWIGLGPRESYMAPYMPMPPSPIHEAVKVRASITRRTHRDVFFGAVFAYGHFSGAANIAGPEIHIKIGHNVVVATEDSIKLPNQGLQATLNNVSEALLLNATILPSPNFAAFVLCKHRGSFRTYDLELEVFPQFRNHVCFAFSPDAAITKDLRRLSGCLNDGGQTLQMPPGSLLVCVQVVKRRNPSTLHFKGSGKKEDPIDLSETPANVDINTQSLDSTQSFVNSPKINQSSAVLPEQQSQQVSTGREMLGPESLVDPSSNISLELPVTLEDFKDLETYFSELFPE